MKPSIVLAAISRSILVLSLMHSPAWADPSESLVRDLTRTAQSGSTLETQLTKNIYRTESFQEEYPEQVAYQEEEIYYEDVPYQVEETYTEQIPYQDTEYYTDYEEYYENEYKCETVGDRECTDVPVCSNRQVCHTVPDRQCHQERVCRPVPGENRCEMVTECGTNAHGERICKERKVCHQEPGSEDCGYVERCEDRSRQECTTEQVCENRRECREVPRERCGYVQVRKTRPVQRSRVVTRYREETRTRIVTRYRQEQRSRTVTKYRTEMRCCRTAYRDVFDHQETLKVLARFPQAAQLIGNEQESFRVMWRPEGISFNVLDSVFGYRIANQQQQGDQIIFDLALAPKYTEEQVGENSIQSVKLMIKPQGSALAIQDLGSLPRIETKISFQIKSLVDGSVLAQGSQATKDTQKIVIPVTQILPIDQDLDVELKVERTSLLLEKPVAFVKKTKHLFDRLNADNFGQATLHNLLVADRVNELVASFFDEGADARMQTQFDFEFKHVRSGQVIFKKSAKAEEILDATKRGFVLIPGKDLVDNDTYLLTLTVKRESKLLDRPVQFTKKVNYVRKIDETQFVGDDKVSGLVLVGTGAELSLQLTDLAPKHPAVEQTYAVKVTARSGFLGLGKKLIAAGVVSRETIEENRERQLVIQMVKDLSANTDDLIKYAKEGKSLMVDLVVTRKSPRLNNGQPVIIKRNMSLKVTKQQ